jgi:D-sedoheptulose 7-phosphate isomerase
MIKNLIQQSINTKLSLLRDDHLITQIENVANLIFTCMQNQGKLIIAGNGGSFADSIHISAEFVARFAKNRQALPAMALGCNGSSLTATANDFNFFDIFARELEAIANKKDIFIGISTSGNSKNIINACIFCNKNDIKTICLTGITGGKLANICECIKVPSNITARIQEIHILIGHIICEIIENKCQ